MGDLVFLDGPPAIPDFSGGGLRSPLIINSLTNVASFYNAKSGQIVAVNLPTLAADPTGHVDATAAITALLNSSLTVLLPGGTFSVSAPLPWRPGQQIFGAGLGLTTIKSSAAQIFVQQPGGLTTGTMRLSGISLFGAAGTLSAIQLQNLDLVTIDFVEIFGLTSASAKPINFVGNVLTWTVANCWIHQCGGDHVYAGSSGGTCNNGKVLSNQFNADVAGVNSFVTIAPLTENVVIDERNNFEGNPFGCNIAMQVSGTIACTIKDNYTEGIAGASIAANAAGTVAKSLTIIGGHFATASTAAADIVLNSTGPNDSVTIINPYFALLGNVGGAPAGIEIGNTANYSITNPSSGSGGTAFLKKGGVTQPGRNFLSSTSSATVNGFVYNPVDNSTTYPDGHRWVSGAGLPNLPFQTNPNVNDEYLQTNGVPLNAAGTGRLFRCTVGGGAPTWVAYA